MILHLAGQDWIRLMILKNFADQDWIGINFIGSGSGLGLKNFIVRSSLVVTTNERS